MNVVSLVDLAVWFPDRLPNGLDLDQAGRTKDAMHQHHPQPFVLQREPCLVRAVLLLVLLDREKRRLEPGFLSQGTASPWKDTGVERNAKGGEMLYSKILSIADYRKVWPQTTERLASQEKLVSPLYKLVTELGRGETAPNKITSFLLLVWLHGLI